MQPTPQPQANRKDQRKAQAALRQKLSPLKKELETLEANIAEIEAAQEALTNHLSNPEVAGDPAKLQETTSALHNLTTKLNNSYSRWDELTSEIETLESQLT